VTLEVSALLALAIFLPRLVEQHELKYLIRGPEVGQVDEW
jgi:hypothetical protein